MKIVILKQWTSNGLALAVWGAIAFSERRPAVLLILPFIGLAALFLLSLQSQAPGLSPQILAYVALIWLTIILWKRLRSVLTVFGALTLAACGAALPPENVANVPGRGGYQLEQRSILRATVTNRHDSYVATSDETPNRNEWYALSTNTTPQHSHNRRTAEHSYYAPNRDERYRETLGECRPHPQYRNLPFLPRDGAARIALGDLLRVTVDDDSLLSGDVEIEADGMLHMPYLPPISVEGLTPAALKERLSSAMVANGLYQHPLPAIHIEALERAPVRVYVSGAVFEPGSVEIAQHNPEVLDQVRQLAQGDAAHRYGVTAALRGAAGLRPDAELRHILIKRNGIIYKADMLPALEDRAFTDRMLLPGDEVHVPSLGCFQPGLARPTIVTRKGAKVHLSNLSSPAFSNAQSAIDDDVREIRYGTTLLQVLVRMNCVGGTRATNAARYAIHIARNRMNGETEVIERAIEDLVRRGDRASYDPVLMPGDAVACYDSTVTNARDIARSFIDILSPIPFSRGL